MSNIPSREDVESAFDRIRTEGHGHWEYHHPLRRFLLAADWAAHIYPECARLAAYRFAAKTPPLGYYDYILDELHLAIELLMKERERDHGDAPQCLYPGSERSKFLRSRRGKSPKTVEI